ncbi:MAG TPA: hypothetical protein VFI27_18475 [candidate division Zixibacteria bacterium]|nr:hypothetical protein [candidate division Zixibacteria bacterium]
MSRLFRWQLGRGYALYRNEGNFGVNNHGLGFRLLGSGPISHDAAGIRVYVTTDDAHD